MFNRDDATQTNDGYSDHIGIVKSVGAKSFETIEGNMTGGVVGHRNVTIGWGYIRGFARPKYSTTSESATTSTMKPALNSGKIGNCSVELQTFLVGAVDPQVKVIQLVLNKLGYKGKDGKKLTVDGNLGTNTTYAIKAF